MTISLSQRALKRCRDLGFTTPHIAALVDFDAQHGIRLKTFVSEGHHGSMDWMDETLDRRLHPQAMWPSAKSAVILGMNYGPDTDPLDNLLYPERGSISVYARNRDYHNLIKGRLKEIAGLISKDTGKEVKVFVDTAPLMEKPLASQSGLGWQGKHTNLVSRNYGSWLFLGTILCAAELTPTKAEIDHCGSCRDCLDICPTDAFPAPYQLDARKCISYLTIEHAGPIDENLRAKMGNRIYGCDDCLAVCPWNKFAQMGRETKLQAREDLNAPNLSELAALRPDDFKTMFSGSPIKRIGWSRFMRNVLYAIGNSEAAKLIVTANRYKDHEDPVLADAARWAIDRLESHV